MNAVLIVGNWKSNKNESETLDFLEQLKDSLKNKHDQVSCVICPSYLSIPCASKFVKENNLPVYLGAQDISPFEEGAYTGEVSGRQLSEFVRYVIIGHSERRQNFNEDNSILFRKADEAFKNDLTPVFCVQDENTPVPESVSIVAYEPIAAIGTGNPDTPENAEKTAEGLKQKNKNLKVVLYGGSVTADNVEDFIKMPNINGVLVGGASLVPSAFLSIIAKC